MESDERVLAWFWEEYECDFKDWGYSVEDVHKDYNTEKNKFFKKHIDGKDVNRCNSSGTYFFHKAAQNFTTEEMMWILNIDNVNVNIENFWGETALHLTNDAGVMSLLLECPDIKINGLDEDDHTPLERAFRRRNIEEIELLLSYGAKIYKDFNQYYWNQYSIKLNTFDCCRTYLPRWNRFTTATRYDKEFSDIAITWLLCCKRIKVISKDIQYLIIEYIAEAWKLQPGDNQYLL